MLVDLTRLGGSPGPLTRRLAASMALRGPLTPADLRLLDTLRLAEHLSDGTPGSCTLLVSDAAGRARAVVRPDTPILVDPTTSDHLVALCVGAPRHTPAWVDVRPWPGTSLDLHTFEVPPDEHDARPLDSLDSLDLWMDCLGESPHTPAVPPCEA